MLAREELSRVPVKGETAVTIGVFDGVHRGHQHLIARLKELAHSRGLATGVVTFHPHPRSVLRPSKPIIYLTGLEERIALLRNLGVDFVAPLTFTGDLSLLSARQFAGLLVQELQVRLIVVGPDFALGRGREGNAQVLSALGQEMGFAVEVVPLIMDDEGEKIGSTAVRLALAKGEMAHVTWLLGRPFSLKGPVVRGAGRGKSLGFPTANIAVAPDRALPPYGVYATKAYVGEACYKSATNIGVRPTFDNGEATIETYILDFAGDLYEKELHIELIERLRDELRFNSVEELIRQMERDVEATREILS